MENLNALYVFTSVAEARSFTAAAKKMGLTSSAVSKGITRLENELGVRLLHRTTRSVGLTEEGERFLEHCQQILLDIEHAENMVRRSKSVVSGRLRVHMPVGFGRQVIMPAMPKFLEQHPDLTLNVELSDRSIDMVYEGVDAAIHIGELADSRLIARKLCNLRFVACASPKYLEKYGEPTTPDDLDHHHCLAYVLMHTGRYREWHFEKDGVMISKTVFGRLNTNNAESLIEAASAGLGIAMISTFIAADAILAGRLRPILTDYSPVGPKISLVHTSTRNASPKIRAFVDFLKDLLPSYPDWDKINL